MRQGRKSAAQTKAPVKDIIKGSSVNKKGSASSTAKASSILLSDEITTALSKKAKDFNEKYKGKKVSVATLKAVFRRGAGAFSTSHRPNITRNGWAYARVNKFLEKKAGKTVKAAYVQDDDLMEKGGLIAPNGKPSNLTPEQYKLVRTSEFKAWFGDWENDPQNASKVVDENGEPLVVYHGTTTEFTIFKLEKPTIAAYGRGFYFTNNKGFASNYARGENAKILNLFLNIRKIFEINENEFPKIYDKYSEMENNKGLSRDFTTKLISEGYDGVYAKNSYNENELVAFNSNQIKLADGTNTKFDFNNSDIRYKEGGNLGQKITCHNCGWQWNTKDSDESDKYVCHKCGFDNTLFYSNDIMGKGGLIAPNGNPSNLNPDQYKLVRTPEFKAWFGDWENDLQNASKVVDENGEPMVVYHGSANKFNVFDKKRVGENYRESEQGGFFFTQKLNTAKNYAKLHSNLQNDGFVYYLFLNIKHPLVRNTNSEYYSPADRYDISRHEYISELRSNKKIDGIIIFGTKKDNLYVVNNSQQIKLADGTNTTFDMKNQDIRFKEGGQLSIQDNGLMDSIYPEIKEAFRHNGLKLEPNYAFTDGANKMYLPHTGMQKTNGKVDRVAITYYNDGYEVLGEIVVDVKEIGGIGVKLDFPDLQVSETLPIFAKGGEVDKVHEKLKEDLINDSFKSHKDIEQIAEEKGVDLEYAKEQLGKGMQTESEHSDDPMVQEIIALQHLDEMIDYYQKLEYMETTKMEKGGQVDPDNKKTKDMITHKAGNAGGLLVGNRHSEGGIKAVNKSTNSPLEMEGGEVVITRNAVSDVEKREFEGKMLTNREILSKINESGGGVSFEDGGKVDYSNKMAKGGELTDAKKESILKVKGNLINFKELLEPTDDGNKSIIVQNFVKSKKSGSVKIEGRSYDTQWFESMQDLINAVDWSKWEGNKMAEGGITTYTNTKLMDKLGGWRPDFSEYATKEGYKYDELNKTWTKNDDPYRVAEKFANGLSKVYGSESVTVTNGSVKQHSFKLDLWSDYGQGGFYHILWNGNVQRDEDNLIYGNVNSTVDEIAENVQKINLDYENMAHTAFYKNKMVDGGEVKNMYVVFFSRMLNGKSVPRIYEMYNTKEEAQEYIESRKELGENGWKVKEVKDMPIYSMINIVNQTKNIELSNFLHSKEKVDTFFNGKDSFYKKDYAWVKPYGYTWENWKLVPINKMADGGETKKANVLISHILDEAEGKLAKGRGESYVWDYIYKSVPSEIKGRDKRMEFADRLYDIAAKRVGKPLMKSDKMADGGVVEPKLVKFNSMYDGMVDAYESVKNKDLYFYVSGEKPPYIVTQESKGYPATEAFDDWLYDYEDAIDIAKKLAMGEDFNDYADGGDIDWGADLGDGFSVGNDVKITDPHSRFYYKTGYVVGKLSQSLVIRVGNDDMDAVVNKKYVQRLEAPEFAKGGILKMDKVWEKKELNNLKEWYKTKLKDSKSSLIKFGFNENHKDFKDAILILDKVKNASEKLIKSGILENGNFEIKYDFKITREGYPNADVMISKSIVWSNPKFMQEWEEYKKEYQYSADKNRFAAKKIGEITTSILGYPLSRNDAYTQDYSGNFIGRDFAVSGFGGYENGGKIDTNSELKQFFQEQNTPIVVEKPIVEEIIEEEVVELPTEIMLYKEDLTSSDDSPMIYVGSSIYANNTNGNDEWVVKSFSNDGVNLLHIPSNPLAYKHEDKNITFDEMSKLFKNNAISIKFVLNERELNLILMIIKDKLQNTQSFKVGGVVMADEDGANDEEIMKSQFGNKKF